MEEDRYEALEKRLLSRASYSAPITYETIRSLLPLITTHISPSSPTYLLFLALLKAGTMSWASPNLTIDIGALYRSANRVIRTATQLPPLPPAFTQSAPKSHSTTPERSFGSPGHGVSASVTKVLSPTPTSTELLNYELRSQQNTKILVGVAAGTILLLLLLRS